MVYQPPAGARDLLPLDVAQKRWIEEHVQPVFHRWGYHRIITSTVEHLDTLMAGGAIQPSTVIQLQSSEDESLGLRPELTASIARAAVTRMTDATPLQRLYYNANVFRRAPKGRYSGQQEFYQAGVELLGQGGVVADAEILLLLSDCLNSLNLNRWHLILGEAGLTRSLLAPFPNPLQDQVRQAIAHLDRISLESLPLSPELRQRALLLMDLRGRPADVLQKVSQLDLELAQRDTVNKLKSLIDLFYESKSTEDAQLTSTPNLILDLSLLQTFDYYTGIVFEIVSDIESGRRVLAQGGRYDELLGLYHPQRQTYPGVGFCLNIEDLHQVLLPTGQLPDQVPASNWLVVPLTAQVRAAAFAYAEKIRTSTNLVRVEMYLDEADASREWVRDYARRCNITQIAWVQAGNLPEIETLS
ncbi:MAG: ATP phosphoribosyltransferase regulatory subunit [Cyanothece sp. SIO1E1]|nr:ATP phosphoribosyltransferase regulatory subunit [Cyanothece sp. SIO1E1]